MKLGGEIPIWGTSLDYREEQMRQQTKHCTFSEVKIETKMLALKSAINLKI